MKPRATRAALNNCDKANEVISIVGDKWTVHVVIVLARAPKRFSDIRHEVTGISQKMLTITLKALERDGYITRAFTPSIPPRVDYQLTELGKGLAKAIRALGAWAVEHYDQIMLARSAYGARPGQGEEPSDIRGAH